MSHVVRRAAIFAVAVLALGGCGGSDSDKGDSAAQGCGSVWGDALGEMGSFMAEVNAGMTAATFKEEYTKLAGPVQLATDEAQGSDCPPEIGERVNTLYRRIEPDSKDPSTIKRWNTDYQTLQADVAALP